MKQDLKYQYTTLLEKAPPTKEENTLLISRAISGREKEKWDLVVRNFRYLFKLVIRYKWRGANFDDTVMAGLIGFYDVVCRLRPCSVEQFLAYSEYHIRVSISRNSFKDGNIFNFAKSKYRYPVVSFSVESESGRTFLSELVDDPSSISPDEHCSNDDTQDFYRSMFVKLWDLELTKKERELISIMISKNCTITDAARRIGFTKQRASQLLKRIGSKFKSEIKEDLLKELKLSLDGKGRIRNKNIKHTLQSIYDSVKDRELV